MMINNRLFKELKTHFKTSKSKNKHYDFDIEINNIAYQMKVLKTNERTQITVNSLTIWEIAKGLKNGIRFKKTSSNLINLTAFNKCENKLIFLTGKPYRILKYLNESDIVVISDEKVINNIKLVRNLSDLLELNN